MSEEFDQIKYQNEYKRQKYDRMEVLTPKGEKALVKEKAKTAGESVNEYIYKAIKKRMAEE